MKLIKNANLLYDNKLIKKNLVIENGKLKKITSQIDNKITEVIDAKNNLVTPGLVDVHVHFREPGQVHKETIKTGSEAAAHGGFTTVGAMPNVIPVPDNVEKFEHQVKLNERSKVKIVQYAPVTLDEISDQLSPIEKLSNAGAFAFSNDGHGIANAKTMFDAMERISQLNSHLAAHVEDQNLFNKGVINSGKTATRLGLPAIQRVAETSQLARDLLLAKETGVHYHVCHISTKDSVELIRIAKDAGINVSCEVTPHHLLLSDEDILTDDANFKMNPPLRSETDREALIAGVLDGTIDMIATDHAPHAKDEKNKGFLKSAFGITGIETSFPLMYTLFVQSGLMNVERLISLMSTRPAKIFNLNAGTIEIGKTADLSIIDLNDEYFFNKSDFLSKGLNTPFTGADWKVSGRIKQTYVNGEKIY
ncbi:dihydroorotase [Companilactobacillus allii]|uniref:Dihydroorotase n=1 Tax=Companilactobacillus allii TaxID=1847728 RepID=A0A1P8Q6C6_9LACO|nr:dihydroorotase [Companilactobacillus allii]APX73406.1 dihydroorotase [Companilactobacillus allii]USQ69882.1 dihydroorotase [Companilactobacillus allii]